jgi:hypothetical protein
MDQLNEVQLSLLTDEQRERYAKLEDLFDHPGWEIVKQYAEAGVASQGMRAMNATSWAEHQQATGARLAFQQVAALPEISYNEFASLAAEAAFEQEEADEIDYE